MGSRAKKTMTLQIPRSYGTHKIAFFMHGMICGAANIQLIGAKNVSDLWNDGDTPSYYGVACIERGSFCQHTTR